MQTNVGVVHRRMVAWFLPCFGDRGGRRCYCMLRVLGPVLVVGAVPVVAELRELNIYKKKKIVAVVEPVGHLQFWFYLRRTKIGAFLFHLSKYLIALHQDATRKPEELFLPSSSTYPHRHSSLLPISHFRIYTASLSTPIVSGRGTQVTQLD